MTDHDLVRLRRAEDATKKADPLITAEQRRKRREELLDAIAGLQSTDEPLGSPEGARIAELERRFLAELRALRALNGAAKGAR